MEKHLFSISCRSPATDEVPEAGWSTNVLAHSASLALAAATEAHPVKVGDMIMVVMVEHIDATNTPTPN